MLASAIAWTLLFAPPDAVPPASGPVSAAEPPASADDSAAVSEPPTLLPPGTLVLAPALAGPYQLFDTEGLPVGAPITVGEGAKPPELQLPPGVYYLHGPAAVDPVVVASGLRLVWDGERVLPVEVWAAAQEARAQEARAQEARVAAELERAQQVPPPSAPAPTWRAWASPLASTLVPGVGQVLNGQGYKGTGLLFGTVGTTIAAAALFRLGNDGTRPLPAEYARLIGYGVFSSAAPLLWIYAITDAYRVATNKEVEPKLDHQLRLSVTRMMTVGFRADTRRPGFYDDWSVSLMGQATRRLSVGVSDLSVKPGGSTGPQVWQLGARLDYRVFDRKRLWIDLAAGSILQVAANGGRAPLDPDAARPRRTTKFGAVPYAQLDLRYFVLDRVSLDLTPRVAIPLTTRYYSANRALPRYAAELELGVSLSTYF
ncbi:hypothetical protein DB30_06376 [Enhygromyxa salina]|uniref:DUF5683 domain-containing protein n=1 Tax=Enhygromyxa salina TaxID=215803 RepID=A0A0C2CYT3_9BACT|nr:hypothetical protein [Enhygromyxa salina]KIG14790.1 hypothetical protein DB30_06376 [Enhygromyxa salina]